MKTPVFFAVCVLISSLLAGCASNDSNPSRIALIEAFEQDAAVAMENGGLAAVGVSESRSLDIALNKAKRRGRVELAMVVERKLDALRDAFIEETDPIDKAQVTNQFSRVAQAVNRRHVKRLAAQTLRYQLDGGGVVACALMELSPQRIVDHMMESEALYARLRETETLSALERERKAYDAYKAIERKPTE